MSLMNKALIASVILLCSLLAITESSRREALKEKEVYKQNTESLLSSPEPVKIDSNVWVTKIKTLQLEVDEYKKYRSDDAKRIEKLNVKLKNLEAVGKHVVSIEIPMDATVKDTVYITDSIPVLKQIVKMDTPYIKIDGIIEDGKLKGPIVIPPVIIDQAIEIDYKHKFLWWQWGVAGINQTIASNNPYVKIIYSEFIKIKKK